MDYLRVPTSNFFKDLTGFERCSSLKGLKECVNFDVPSMPNICFANCTQNFRNCLHNTSAVKITPIMCSVL
ncbi:hypothetical protein RIF29_19576 [Crotalaria pallida]|uniref:Uncharacterized protein n=1 Tax=Crotalaria pallida TaxID=3830 RepID=A0AAN9F202_CROPI